MKIAPKLSSGDIRVRFGSRLPDAIKEGLRSIANYENESMSWVVEQIIIKFFRLPIPRYKGEKRGRILSIKQKRYKRITQVSRNDRVYLSRIQRGNARYKEKIG